MSTTSLHVDGKPYVLIPEADYDRLLSLADQLPPLPAKDENGERPAVATGIAIIARGIVRRRVTLGLSRGALARLAGISPLALRRLESGQHRPERSLLLKVDRALNSAEKRSTQKPTRARVTRHTIRSAA